MQRIIRPRSALKILATITPKTKSPVQPESKAPLSTTPAHQDDWKLFRQIEKESAPHRPRTTTVYKANYAAGIMFPFSQELFESKDDPKALLRLSKNSILEHAARRVDLFFYTLVAYYRTGIAPIAGASRLQHGKGRIRFDTKEAITQAAHSSFVTSLVDKTILAKNKLFSTIENSHLHIATSILCPTHFMDSLNQTMELPTFVNELDFEIEFLQGGRDKSFKIIRAVANGECDPVQGLLQFLQLMKEIFSNLKANDEVFNAKSKLSKKFKLALVGLEEQGTFINKLSKDETSVNPAYIHMLLRLKPNEIAICKNKKAKGSKLLAEKIKVIQAEIMAKPSAHLRPTL